MFFLQLFLVKHAEKATNTRDRLENTKLLNVRKNRNFNVCTAITNQN